MRAAMLRLVDGHSAPVHQAAERASPGSTTGHPDDARARPERGGLVDALLQLQRIGGNRQVQQVVAQLRQAPGRPPLIQPKLVVGRADDAYEREADRIAQMVGSGGPPCRPTGGRRAG